jgi:hypothetical protein
VIYALLGCSIWKRNCGISFYDMAIATFSDGYALIGIGLIYSSSLGNFRGIQYFL